MLISELQDQLEAIKQEHGDLNCYSFFEVDIQGNGYYSNICSPRVLDSLQLNAGDYLVISRDEKGVHIC